MSLGLAVQEALWLRGLLEHLGFDLQHPTLIKGDNKGAIDLAQNSRHHDRSKHIDIKHHFLRQHVRDEKIRIEWISTNDNHSDLLTKALGKTKFEKFRNLLLNTTTELTLP